MLFERNGTLVYLDLGKAICLHIRFPIEGGRGQRHHPRGPVPGTLLGRPGDDKVKPRPALPVVHQANFVEHQVVVPRQEPQVGGGEVVHLLGDDNRHVNVPVPNRIVMGAELAGRLLAGKRRLDPQGDERPVELEAELLGLLRGERPVGNDEEQPRNRRALFDGAHHGIEVEQHRDERLARRCGAYHEDVLAGKHPGRCKRLPLQGRRLVVPQRAGDAPYARNAGLVIFSHGNQPPPQPQASPPNMPVISQNARAPSSHSAGGRQRKPQHSAAPGKGNPPMDAPLAQGPRARAPPLSEKASHSLRKPAKFGRFAQAVRRFARTAAPGAADCGEDRRACALWRCAPVERQGTAPGVPAASTLVTS